MCEIDAAEAMAFVLYTLSRGSILDQASMDAFLDVHRPRNIGSLAQLWEELGTAIAKRYNSAAPERVVDMAHEELFRFLDADNENCPSSFKFAIDKLLEAEAPLRAVAFAHAFLDAFLSDLVARDNAFDIDFDMFFDAFCEQFTSCDYGIVVIRKETPTKHINRFLREVDFQQTAKFVVAPRGESGWQLLTVNYKLQPFNTYVPISTRRLPGITFVHRKNFYATASSLDAALALARQSMAEYTTWGNLPNRMLRWWRE